MHIYAAMFGSRNGSFSQTIPGAIQAKNEEEAMVKLMDAAHENWPQEDGWDLHCGLVVLIPDEWIMEIVLSKNPSPDLEPLTVKQINEIFEGPVLTEKHFDQTRIDLFIKE